MFRSLRSNRNTLVSLAGVLVGILGLLIQWIADPAKFAGAESTFGLAFPPGIVFLVVAGALTLITARWWWHPVFAAFMAFWIVGVGTVAGKLTPNLLSHNAGTVTGNVVMALGLIVAVIAGVVGMISAFRTARQISRS